ELTTTGPAASRTRLAAGHGSSPRPSGCSRTEKDGGQAFAIPGHAQLQFTVILPRPSDLPSALPRRRSLSASAPPPRGVSRCARRSPSPTSVRGRGRGPARASAAVGGHQLLLGDAQTQAQVHAQAAGELLEVAPLQLDRSVGNDLERRAAPG